MILRISRKVCVLLGIATFMIAIASHPLSNSIASAKPTWITRSNENTNILIKAASESNCTEQTTLSESLLELNSAYVQCYEKNLNNAIQTFQNKLRQETDPSVKIDLEILIASAQEELRSNQLDQQYQLPYVNLAREINRSLDKLNARDFNKRVKQLSGDETGTPAIATVATQKMREALTRSNILFPEKFQLEKDLADTPAQLEQIRQRLERRGIDPALYPKLKAQLTEYNTFVQREILPKARTNFRLSPELYAQQLAERGVEISIDELLENAHTAFTNIQQEMNKLAPQIAKQRGLQAKDYRDVIRALKQEQLPADQILPHYQKRQKEIEAIIQREKLVTLPSRPLTIRLTSDRENATFPVPQYQSPRNSQKTAGVFIIPLIKPDPKPRVYNDFTYSAVSWTLTAHEGRPGHDLQFTTIQDKGTSQARSRYGYNPANHEGWALYAEAITLPYMPIDGQFISLQFQLLRAARAFLEPELHLGKISIDQALRVLMEDAGYSEFFARQEIDRYTTRLPGHAPSYFYGYQRLMQLRRDVEQRLGQKFNQQQFHDFILSQGFMPQRLLRQAVLEQFVPAG
ncbi:DUF885 domain-containing protein [Leptolyngbya sp. NIES-2104]|uniref:DUF885 domain-containing protein n=1 Tax=Leptolyngbya sp. NIES-2104 TaxID=1552121 RepID=UPI00073EC9CC|nr:DUF885 domain-containing protein [Leptolyngbya sp. NIES-2104]